ncbi:hypothetical protein [Aureibacillus halotolerans]|uniref:Uncharacterized protein n=1 Tax=Aureibacillus halotolerans TaxID=1508390 RepID=A0A4V3D4E8_9BACI|nr:hypothetical protein [Aureibacillus halotolerans]TDQ35258.1 hypothetical protein EV213_12245 [Aureibacillus halotolerans]
MNNPTAYNHLVEVFGEDKAKLIGFGGFTFEAVHYLSNEQAAAAVKMIEKERAEKAAREEEDGQTDHS